MALSKILENSITDGVVSSAKLKDFAAAVDLNGVELILDARPRYFNHGRYRR